MTTSTLDKKELIKYLKSYFRLDWLGIHGSPHWARVLLNGTYLAEKENARLDVITLFAFLHDHEREHDNADYVHGLRAAKNAAKLRDVYFTIDDEGFNLLCYAMDRHSDGETQADITVQCCWDADRLDLGRIGIYPDADRLCTKSAKDPEFIKICADRSIK